MSEAQPLAFFGGGIISDQLLRRYVLFELPIAIE